MQHSTTATLKSVYLQFGILSWSVLSVVSEPPTTCCQSSGTATFVSLYLSDHLHTLQNVGVIHPAWSLSARTVFAVPSCLCWTDSVPDSLNSVVIQLLPVSLGSGILQITCVLAPGRNLWFRTQLPYMPECEYKCAPVYMLCFAKYVTHKSQ